MTITWIYLIKDNMTGYHKIGRSDDPNGRLNQLKKQATLQPTANDYVLVEAWQSEPEFEQELHEIFKTERVRGEWFNLHPDHIADIEDMFFSSKRYVKEGSAEDDYNRDWEKHQFEVIAKLEKENAALKETIKNLESQLNS